MISLAAFLDTEYIWVIKVVLHIPALIATCVQCYMNIYLSIITRLAAIKDKGMRSKVHSYFLHIHLITIFRSKARHRVVKQEEFDLSCTVCLVMRLLMLPLLNHLNVLHQVRIQDIKQRVVLLC